jgi:phosphoglycolate phosphatase
MTGAGPRLAVFDVDGTLVDSLGHIHAAMSAAFAAMGRQPPPRPAVEGVIGLSLPIAIAEVDGDLHGADLDRAVVLYKDAFATLADAGGPATAPLYPGVLPMLDRLAATDGLLLAVATGKSRRGLNRILDMHGLHGRFVTLQVADDHPSKPHPAMLLTAADAVGCATADCVMIGDTVFDLQMAKAAGMPALAVTWGYHRADRLRAERPAAMAEAVADLPDLIAVLHRDLSQRTPA